jgi:sialic acid synthase SpsE
VKIANREIGPSNKPLVVAEIGINHGGDLAVAKRMVTLASQAGAECVKHQTHFIEDEMTDSAKEIYPPNADISIWEVMKTNALSRDDEISLRDHALGLGVIYISTPFSRLAADFLDDINVPAFKIGSGEADNIPLIRHIAAKGKPIIMSTGMQSIESIETSINILREADIEFALLECTNLYPSPPSIVSLKGVRELQSAFPDAIVGFSDHSIGSEMALASVALGACILERHFVDTRYRKGPDVSCSMDPAELRWLIDRSVEIHTALHNDKRRTKAEESVYQFARASIVADKNLQSGHTITEPDIWARRPGDGEIPAASFDLVVGKTLNRDVSRNTQLCWLDFTDD